MCEPPSASLKCDDVGESHIPICATICDNSVIDTNSNDGAPSDMTVNGDEHDVLLSILSLRSFAHVQPLNSTSYLSFS